LLSLPFFEFSEQKADLLTKENITPPIFLKFHYLLLLTIIGPYFTVEELGKAQVYILPLNPTQRLNEPKALRS